MSDQLISGLPDHMAFSARARRLGVSSAEFLPRLVVCEVRAGSSVVAVGKLNVFADRYADLGKIPT